MKKTSNGFTLIEVLVALSIFAVAVASLSGALQNSVRNADYIKEKTIAHWIANNKMVEMQAADNFPPIADRTEKVEFAGRQWVVRTKVEKANTAMPVRIAEVSVGVNVDGEVNYYSIINGIFSDTKS